MSIGGFVLPIGLGAGMQVGGDEFKEPVRKAIHVASALPYAYGVLVGPSTAHLYLGEYAHVLTLFGVRLGTIALFFAGFGLAVTDCLFEESCGSRGETLMVLSVLGYAGAVGYDFYDSTRAAKRHSRVSLMPVVTAWRGGGVRLGVTW